MLKAAIKGALVGMGLVLLVSFVAALAGAAMASDSKGHGQGATKAGLCHRTASDTNPYVYILVDDDSLSPGHLDNADPGHKPTQWKSDGTWRGVEHKAGDPKDDYLATLPGQCQNFPTPTPTPTETEGTPTPTPTETTPTPTPTETETTPTPTDKPTPTATPSGSGQTPDGTPDAGPKSPDEGRKTLPHTGAATAALALLSLALIATGAALLKGTRKRA